jgi:hypothetical protein
MQIDKIYVSGWRGDVRFTKCCVASIRQWYPDVKICLIKDELGGNYDTSTLERAYDVEIFGSSSQMYGWGMAKLEPLFQPNNERCLIIDSDVIFVGPVLEGLERLREDFVVVDEDHPESEIKENYFAPQQVENLYPEFRFPGYVFNTGQFVARCGILTRSDFLPFVSFDQPPRLLMTEVFKCGEQGLLNFVLLSKHQAGALTLRRAHFMRWSPGMREEEVELALLGPDSTYDFLLHWAGSKDYSFKEAPLGYLLCHFDAIYNRQTGDHAVSVI